MSDSIMSQIRAQQANEQARRDSLELQEQTKIRADYAKFASEAPEIISILRQHGVAPQPVAMCDHSGEKYRDMGRLDQKGWLINGVRFGDKNNSYPVTMHVALMENGVCIPCVPPSSNMPKSTVGSLVVLKGALLQPYWGMEFDASREVRRLIGE